MNEEQADDADVHLEHRWGLRSLCKALVRLSTGTGITGTGRVRDISTSGAFIETTARLAVNAQVDLVILGNESATHTVELAATVVRVEREGIGVEWCRTPARSICAVVGCSVRCAENAPAAFQRGEPRRTEEKSMRRKENCFEDIEEMFDEADQDRDDHISLTEFRGLMTALGRHLRDDAAATQFEKIDGNHDGRIGFEEFRAWFLGA